MTPPVGTKRTPGNGPASAFRNGDAAHRLGGEELDERGAGRHAPRRPRSACRRREGGDAERTCRRRPRPRLVPGETTNCAPCVDHSPRRPRAERTVPAPDERVGVRRAAGQPIAVSPALGPQRDLRRGEAAGAQRVEQRLRLRDRAELDHRNDAERLDAADAREAAGVITVMSSPSCPPCQGRCETRESHSRRPR